MAFPIPRSARSPATGDVGSPDIWSRLGTGLHNNSNALIGLGSGLLSGDTFAEGLARGGDMWRGGAEKDDAYATQQKAEAERIKGLNSTLEYMRSKGYDDLVSGVEGGGLDMGTAWGEALKRSAPKTPEAFTLGPGEARYQGDQLIAQGPEDTKAAFGNEKDLAAQYTQQDPVKTYQAVRNSYERVRQSAEMGNNNPDGSGAADLSLIFAYMKMLDPTSVVREGEQASAANAGGVPAQVMNLYNNLVKGDKLTPGVRQQFVQSADAIYKDTAQNLSQANDQFSTRAQGWNVDPSRFVTQPESYPAFAPPAPTGNQPRRTQTGVTWSP